MSILVMDMKTRKVRFRLSTINSLKKTKSFLILKKSRKKRKINPFLLTPNLNKRTILKFSILILRSFYMLTL